MESRFDAPSQSLNHPVFSFPAQVRNGSPIKRNPPGAWENGRAGSGRRGLGAWDTGNAGGIDQRKCALRDVPVGVSSTGPALGISLAGAVILLCAPGAAFSAEPVNSLWRGNPGVSAQLIWPGAAPSILWHIRHLVENAETFGSSWPKPAWEVCPETAGSKSGHGAREDSNSTTASRSSDAFLIDALECRRVRTAPVFGISGNLGFHPVQKRYPIGDSLDDFGNPSGRTLALAVSPDLGQAWENVPPFMEIELNWAFSRSLFAHFRGRLERALDAWHDDALGGIAVLEASEVNINEPSQGYLSWNLPYFHLILGRFGIHWSPDPWYGLTMTRSVPYHDGIMATLRAPLVRYHFLASSLDPWLSGTPSRFGADVPVGSEEYRQSNPGYSTGESHNFNFRNRVYDSPVRTLLAHRLEIAWGHLEWGITEINMVGGRAPGFRDGNPFTLFHNNFSHGAGALGVGTDFKISAGPGAALVGELFLNDFQEADDGGDPTLLGWAVGIHHALKSAKWSVLHGLYFAWTDAFLYIQRAPLLRHSSRHVVHSNYVPLGANPFIDSYVIDYPLGYFRGPDARDLWYNLEIIGRRAGANLTAGLLQHGERSLLTPFEKKEVRGPSGVVAGEWRGQISAWLTLVQNLRLTFGYALQILDNAGHVAGESAAHNQIFANLNWRTGIGRPPADQ